MTEKLTFAVYDEDLQPVGVMTWPIREGERVVKVPALIPVSGTLYMDAEPGELIENCFHLEMVPLTRRTEKHGERRGWFAVTDNADLARTRCKK